MNNFINKIIDRTLQRQQISIKPYRLPSILEDKFVIPQNFNPHNKSFPEIENSALQENQFNDEDIGDDTYLDKPVSEEPYFGTKKSSIDNSSSQDGKPQDISTEKLTPSRYQSGKQKENSEVDKNSSEHNDDKEISISKYVASEKLTSSRYPLQKQKENSEDHANYSDPYKELNISKNGNKIFDTKLDLLDDHKKFENTVNTRIENIPDEARTNGQDSAKNNQGFQQDIANKVEFEKKSQVLENYKKNRDDYIIPKTRVSYSDNKRNTKRVSDEKSDYSVNIIIENIDVKAISPQKEHKKDDSRILSLKDYLKRREDQFR